MTMIKVAIDGYSSTGKSTMARSLAKAVGYRYIDSGAMYRAVALFALQNKLIKESVIDTNGIIDRLDEIHINFMISPTGTQRTFLNNHDVEDDIRSLKVSSVVSQVAAIPEVRHSMVELQRKLGSEGGIVMDGRDIGTTVFPDAQLKIFVTASPETRARRRFNEMIEKGEQVDFDEILENIKERDHLDETRTVSPLRQAPDAILLDNSSMTLQEQSEWLLEQFRLCDNN
ncbi:MAG: (d)CMP kinase [Muribaculaceae bacterium]|nr:(d)CMP kinase [Muribaculaceae bacterium]